MVKKTTSSSAPAASKVKTSLAAAASVAKKDSAKPVAPASSSPAAGKLTKAAAASAVAAKLAARRSAGVVLDAKDAAAAAATVAEKKAASAKKALNAGGKRAEVKPFKAIVLRNLPEAFQEPEILKFFGQFGPAVHRCYVVRVRGSCRSRGVAFVQFAASATETELDAIVEEANHMVLGERTVSVKLVTLKKEFPAPAQIRRLQRVDFSNRTRGVRLTRHENGAAFPSKASSGAAVSAAGATAAADAAPVATASNGGLLRLLQQQAAKEAKQNEALKQKGIAYSFDGFSRQLKLAQEAAAKGVAGWWQPPVAAPKAALKPTTDAAAA